MTGSDGRVRFTRQLSRRKPNEMFVDNLHQLLFKAKGGPVDLDDIEWDSNRLENKILDRKN